MSHESSHTWHIPGCRNDIFLNDLAHEVFNRLTSYFESRYERVMLRNETIQHEFAGAYADCDVCIPQATHPIRFHVKIATNVNEEMYEDYRENSEYEWVHDSIGTIQEAIRSEIESHRTLFLNAKEAKPS